MGRLCLLRILQHDYLHIICTTINPNILVVLNKKHYKYGGAMLIMNSCGTLWGTNGFTWVRYKDFADNTKYAFEMYLDPKQNPTPQPIPVSPKHKLAGNLRFVLSTGEEMPMKYISGAYESFCGYISGTRYRLYVSNNEPAYVYVIASDATRTVSKVFPPRDNMSPALTYSSNNIAIPDEKWFIEMDDNKGTDNICVLYSAEPLDIKSVINTVNGKHGGFRNNIEKALAGSIIETADIKFNDVSIGFNAESDKSVVSVFVDIKHI